MSNSNIKQERIAKFIEERKAIQRPCSIPITRELSKMEVDLEKRLVRGYPIVWNEVNDHREMVVRGATARSLNARGVGSTKNPILLLQYHNVRESLAKPHVLQEDDYGLYFEANIITDVAYADEAVAKIQQEVLRQMSYGFDYDFSEGSIDYNPDLDAIILRQIVLYEISLVTFSSGESAQLRWSEYQQRALLEKYTPDQLRELETILHLQRTEEKPPVTNTGKDTDNNASSVDSFLNLLTGRI